MCGRYLFSQEITMPDVRQLLKQQVILPEFRTGEIFPTNAVPLLIPDKSQSISLAVYKWGFPGFGKGKTIINARAETALEKRMFKKSVEERRCVVPATGFYEWDSEKQKTLFTMPDGSLFMAGIYNEFDGKQCFVILTTEANPSVSDIHHRMPVVLNRNDINSWLFNVSEALKLLHTTPPMLERTAV